MSRIERKKQAAEEKNLSKSKKSGRKARFDEKMGIRNTAEVDAAAINKAASQKEAEKSKSAEAENAMTAADGGKAVVSADADLTSAAADGKEQLSGTAADKKNKGKKLTRFKNWFKGLQTWKKALFIAGIALLVIIIVGGAIAYAYFNSIFDEIHQETPEDYDLSLVDVDGYYNILLLGVDSRDMDNLDNTRSDAIMMVSINKDTNEVKVLSVYRDTYLKMGDTSTYDKITHACFYDGPEMTMKTMNQAMDLNISNYVVVTFKAVADLVDAVGGIEVDVQDYEIEQLNKYTIETAKNIGHDDYKLVESAGVQTLEGVQAVSYGRIRKGVGDDFKRTERMRTVISLVMDKMKDMSFKDMKKIIKMMTPQVKTNLSRNDILGLAIRLPQYNITETTGWPYNVSTGYVDEVSYVFPSNLAENVEKLHREFFGQEDYTISATVSNISAAIVQKIEAARQSNQLKDEETEVEPNKPQETVPETPTKPADPVEPTVPSEPTEPSVDPDNPGTTDPTPEEPTNPGTSTDPGTTTPDPDVPDGSGSGNTGGNTSSSGAGNSGSTLQTAQAPAA